MATLKFIDQIGFTLHYSETFCICARKVALTVGEELLWLLIFTENMLLKAFPYLLHLPLSGKHSNFPAFCPPKAEKQEVGVSKD